MEQMITRVLERFVSGVYFPDIRFTDVLEVLILTVVIYRLISWIKNTKAWMLLKGILFVAGFILLAFIFQMHTILFIARKLVAVTAMTAVVVFQPEIRRALERLGEKQFSITSMVPFEGKKDHIRFSDKTRDGIVDACFSMGRVKTGALIVVEQVTQLSEYEVTGIEMDCLVSMQVLINIFEHNTPLHDGAIIVRGDRIVSATCYLPLSDNMALSKELGTRHRAAVGMSEVSDALVIAVSEETGAVSVAQGGTLKRHVTKEELRQYLDAVRAKNPEKSTITSAWKGWFNRERKTES